MPHISQVFGPAPEACFENIFTRTFYLHILRNENIVKSAHTKDCGTHHFAQALPGVPSQVLHVGTLVFLVPISRFFVTIFYSFLLSPCWWGGGGGVWLVSVFFTHSPGVRSGCCKSEMRSPDISLRRPPSPAVEGPETGLQPVCPVGHPPLESVTCPLVASLTAATGPAPPAALTARHALRRPERQAGGPPVHRAAGPGAAAQRRVYGGGPAILGGGSVFDFLLASILSLSSGF